jgi:hypothetical protein
MSDTAVNSLNALETELAKIMRPIEPPQAFKGHLLQRLTSTQTITIEERTAGKAFLIVSLGLFSGVLVFWFGHLLRGK